MSIKSYRQSYARAANFISYEGNPWKALQEIVKTMRTLPDAQRLAFAENDFLGNAAFNPACVGKTKITDEENIMAQWKTTEFLQEITSLLPKTQRPKFAKTFLQSPGARYLSEEQLAQYIEHVVEVLSPAQVTPLLQSVAELQPQAAMRGFYAGVEALQGRKKAELINVVLESDLYKTPENYVDFQVARFNVFMCGHLPQAARPAFIEQNFLKSKQFNAMDIDIRPSSESPIITLIEALATLTPVQREATLKNGFLTNYAGKGLKDQKDRMPAIVDMFCEVGSSKYKRLHTPEVTAAANQAYWVMQDSLDFRSDLFRKPVNLPVMHNA